MTRTWPWPFRCPTNRPALPARRRRVLRRETSWATRWLLPCDRDRPLIRLDHPVTSRSTSTGGNATPFVVCSWTASTRGPGDLSGHRQRLGRGGSRFTTRPRSDRRTRRSGRSADDEASAGRRDGETGARCPPVDRLAPRLRRLDTEFHRPGLTGHQLLAAARTRVTECRDPSLAAGWEGVPRIRCPRPIRFRTEAEGQGGTVGQHRRR